MKRIIVLCLALTLIFSALPISSAVTTVAAEDATEAIILEDFSRRKVGEKFDDDEIICAESQGHATCVNTLGALGGVNAVKFEYDSLRGYHNIAGDQGFKIVYQNPKSLDDITHLVYYFRMPLSKSDDEGNNWGKSGVALMMYLGGYNWSQFEDDAEVEILSKDGRTWKKIPVNSIYLDVPSGFEGYIKVGLDDYKITVDNVKYDLAEYVKKNPDTLSLHQTILQFSNMGDQCGSAYCNAVYGVTKNTDSLMVKLNGEKEARFYTTGATNNDIKNDKELLKAAMKAEVLHTYSTHPIGYRLDDNGLMKYQNKRDITTKLAENVGGLMGYPSVEISSPILGGFHDSNPMYELKYPAFQYAEGMQAIMFYVKCAGPHPAQPTRSTFRFNIFTEKDGQPTWSLLGAGSGKYLQMGDNKWRLCDSEDDQGIMILPPNFEGYIMIDLKDMQVNSIADDLEDRWMISSTLQFQATGGDAGNCYVGGIYKITDKNDKLETLITFNDCHVYSLLDGKIADKKDLVVEGPRIGEIFEEIPGATSALKSKVTGKTDKSFDIEYDEESGASKYRIEIYGNQMNDDEEIEYYCAQSVTTNGKQTKITVDGLEPSTRYYIVVNALNSYGEAYKIYEFSRETTASEGQATGTAKVNANKSNGGIKSIIHKMSSNYTIPVVIGGGVAAVVVIAAAVVFIILNKKRKGGA